jgi:hypothetical protein
LILFLILIGALLFGKLSRMCGGGSPRLPLGLDQWLYAVPYGVVAALAANLWVALGVYLLAVLAKRTGHGQYMDLGTWNTPVKPERLDPVVSLFYGPDTFDNYWRDFCGLVVTGAAVSLGAFLTLLVTGTPLLAFGVLLGGMLKGVAYSIGWRFKESLTEYHVEPTACGEFLTGFFAGVPLALALWVLLGVV